MSRCFLGLFVCFLLGGVSADGPLLLMTRLMRCQYDDSLSYLESSNGSHFFINQKAVDHLLFCEAIEFRIAQGCLLHSSSHTVQWRRIGEKYCSRDFSKFAYVESNSLTAKKFRRTGRKLLLHPQTNASISSELSRDGQWKDGIEKEHSHWPFSLKKMAIAIPTAFLLCCVFMCPCFRAKRKEPSDQAVLPKELYTIDSVSSVDVSTHSERIPGSPFRVPQSPLRVPPSPLRVPPSPSRFSMSPQLSRVGSVHLSINQLVKATQNFSPSNIIGEGGFGTVYKAQLPDGQVVAIKRARREHFAALRTQFSNEVDLLAKIEHRNLVRLLGYIDKGNERIIITEYVQNGTLREHLDGQHGKTLDFNQRLEISIDVAHALTYLHLYAEKPIIHRDVKSSNILLTESFRAKVADFGFAKTGPTDEDKTHISTKVKGTAGYLDPEYLKTYQLTPKSDVFSFGILLLEILSGRRPVEMKKAADERITVRWAYKKFNEGNASEVLDPMLEEVVDGELLSKILDLAFQCTAPTRADRPTMKEVVEQLWEIRKVYRSLRRE